MDAVVCDFCGDNVTSMNYIDHETFVLAVKNGLFPSFLYFLKNVQTLFLVKEWQRLALTFSKH